MQNGNAQKIDRYQRFNRAFAFGFTHHDEPKQMVLPFDEAYPATQAEFTLERWSQQFKDAA